MPNHPPNSRRRETGGSERSRLRVSPWAIWVLGVPFVMVPLFFGLYMLGHNPIEPLLQALESEALLESQIEQLEQENTALERDVDALSPGQFGIEKRARERLGWSKPGEVVIHVPNKR